MVVLIKRKVKPIVHAVACSYGSEVWGCGKSSRAGLSSACMWAVRGRRWKLPSTVHCLLFQYFLHIAEKYIISMRFGVATHFLSVHLVTRSPL